MDICVVTYKQWTATAVGSSLRPQDVLWTRDNTHDNVGFASACNQLARQGIQPLIAFVNPDGEPLGDCFDRLEAAFVDERVVAAQASQGPPEDRAPLNADGDMDWLCGGCLVVRRWAFERVGGFDARFFMYYEDADLSYKLRPLGLLRHVADAHFKHDRRPRPYIAIHRTVRNYLVVERRYRMAHPLQVIRDAVWSLRQGRPLDSMARLTGLADYWVRAWRWA